MKKYLSFIIFMNISLLCFCQNKELSIFGIKFTDSVQEAVDKIKNNYNVSESFQDDEYERYSTVEHFGTALNFKDPIPTYAAKQIEQIIIYSSRYDSDVLHSIVLYYKNTYNNYTPEEISAALCEVYKFKHSEESTDDSIILKSDDLIIKLDAFGIVYTYIKSDTKDKAFVENEKQEQLRKKIDEIKAYI